MQHCPNIGIGIGISLRSTSAFSGLLNLYPGAAAAYSLRRFGPYGGPVVEVRRSSDSTTDTFTANQITGGDLVAFCGAGDGFVPTWYDQSGSANNATQGTTTSQPKIVSAGALVVGGLDFDGRHLETSLVPQNVMTYIAVADPLTFSNGLIVGARDSTNQRSYMGQGASFNSTIGVGSQNNLFGSINDWMDDSIAFGTYDGSNVNMYINGANTISSAQTVDPNNTTRGIAIGAMNDAGTFTTIPWRGTGHEIIIYTSDQSANRAGIETNINDFYSIF